MNIAFFGTPEYCVPSLEALVASRHKVVCVVTQPDRPSGRGSKMTVSPAKKFALENNIPVFQPKSISKELDVIFPSATSRDGVVKPDIIVTCAFGQILKQNVIDFCRYGVINVHASLLPKYRGACPINFAIINGETKTGITIMQTDVGIDTGDILYQVECDISEHETAGELTARLAVLGAEALIKTLDQIENGTVKRTPQNNAEASYYPMLKKEDGALSLRGGQSPTWQSSVVNFNSPKDIVNFIRGMNPWPGAHAPSNYGEIRVLAAHVDRGELRFDIIQAPGGRAMAYRDYVNGHKNFKFI